MRSLRTLPFHSGNCPRSDSGRWQPEWDRGKLFASDEFQIRQPAGVQRYGRWGCGSGTVDDAVVLARTPTHGGKETNLGLVSAHHKHCGCQEEKYLTSSGSRRREMRMRRHLVGPAALAFSQMRPARRMTRPARRMRRAQ